MIYSKKNKRHYQIEKKNGRYVIWSYYEDGALDDCEEIMDTYEDAKKFIFSLC